jgi:hypothetical protein
VAFGAVFVAFGAVFVAFGAVFVAFGAVFTYNFNRLRLPKIIKILK